MAKRDNTDKVDKVALLGTVENHRQRGKCGRAEQNNLSEMRKS